MTRFALATLTVAALIATYLWAINTAHTGRATRHGRHWDEYGDVDAHPLEPGVAGCRECGWITTHPDSTVRMYAYLDHRDADHG